MGFEYLTVYAMHLVLEYMSFTFWIIFQREINFDNIIFWDRPVKQFQCALMC